MLQCYGPAERSENKIHAQSLEHAKFTKKKISLDAPRHRCTTASVRDARVQESREAFSGGTRASEARAHGSGRANTTIIRAGSNSFKLKEGKFGSGVRKKSFPRRAARPWCRAGGAPSLGGGQGQAGWDWGAGTRWIFSSLPSHHAKESTSGAELPPAGAPARLAPCSRRRRLPPGSWQTHKETAGKGPAASWKPKLLGRVCRRLLSNAASRKSQENPGVSITGAAAHAGRRQRARTGAPSDFAAPI